MKFEQNPLNPYIAFAISQISQEAFTVNDLVSHLPAVERFSEKEKAWQFVYQQLRKLVDGCYLSKRQRCGNSRFEYLRTAEFELLHFPELWVHPVSDEICAPKLSRKLLTRRLEGKKARYKEELEYLIGERDVIADLLPEYPDIETEIRFIYSELNKKSGQLRGKISAIDRIISGGTLRYPL